MNNNIVGLLLLYCAVLGATKLNNKLPSLIQNIHIAEQFQSIFVLRTFNETLAFQFGEDFIKDISTTLNIPVIVSTDTTPFSLKKTFNENILAIVLLDSKKLLLRRLLEYLQHMRHCKTIFLLTNQSGLVFELEDLFSFCWENQMINVMAIFYDFQDSPVFYRYTRFPVFTIEKVNWGENQQTTYFPNRLRDLRRIYLPVTFGGPEPGIIISRNAQGEHVIKGYMGHFFHALAQKHNARLNNSNVLFRHSDHELRDMVLNGTIEISAAALYIISPSINWISYPYNIVNWCLMIPIEPKAPIFKVFAIVFQWDALVITIGLVVLSSVSLELSSVLWCGKKFCFFNDNYLRVVLKNLLTERPNASFSLTINYVMVFFFGIMLATAYGAFLQTLMTSPPSEKRIQSFDDVLLSKLKVRSPKAEMDNFFDMCPDFKNKYKEIFQIEKNYNIFNQLRSSLNTNFAYTVNTVKWKNLENKQKLFSQPLFRLPQKMCLLNGSRYVFSINENSIYKGIVNFLILETHSSGLLEFWLRRSFYELLDNGKKKLIDPTSKFGLEPMKVVDLKWVWTALVMALAFDTLCFLGEIYVSWKQSGNFFSKAVTRKFDETKKRPHNETTILVKRAKQMNE